MTFLAPIFLVAAAAAAAAAVALHIISTREPRVEVLPTARFIPRAPLTARARTARLTDRVLLLLRVLLILTAGLALARPVWTASRQPVARVVVVDVSSAVSDARELADSTAAWAAGAAVVTTTGDRVRELNGAAADSVAVWAAAADPGTTPASISTMLIAGQRAAARLRDRADSVELVIVSPFATTQWDAATATVRALWPGAITMVRVAAASGTTTPIGDDGAVTARVEWADSGLANAWTRRELTDTVNAVRAGDEVLIYPFERAWTLSDADATVIARWIDGEPAGIEITDNDGCVRSFAFVVPSEGDVALRPSFQRFTQHVEAPCGPVALEPLPDTVLHVLRGPATLTAAGDIARADVRATPLMVWLLLLCLLLLAGEQVLRRRS